MTHWTERLRLHNVCIRCGAPELEETIPITDGLCAGCKAEDEERVASEEARD